jgi:hypothetical protein
MREKKAGISLEQQRMVEQPPDYGGRQTGFKPSKSSRDDDDMWGLWKGMSPHGGCPEVVRGLRHTSSLVLSASLQSNGET